MISPATASLALSVAKDLIKLAGRADHLRAEKLAVRSGLALTLPAVTIQTGPRVIVERLRRYQADTPAAQPAPLTAPQRAALDALMPPAYVYQPADLETLRGYYKVICPEAESDTTTIVPDKEYLTFLRNVLPAAPGALPANPGEQDREKLEHYQAARLAVAFTVDPGQDVRDLGYPVRLGLLVVDVLAEFGAEHTQLFVRDERLRGVVKRVLQRFAQPDLEAFDTWSPLVRHVLSSTLNGVLDARDSWQGEDPWLGATLAALAEARTAAGDQGDNYLLGLLQGRGYRLFLGHALAQAAGVLDAADAPAFQTVLADLLNTASPLVLRDQNGFGAFFSAHWPDLVHAALVSVRQHGPQLMQGQSPVVRDVLTAVVNALATDAVRANYLSSDTLFATVQAAIGAVATHPEIWGAHGWPGLGPVLSSVLAIAADQGVQATFTKSGLAEILRGATATVAAHPEWLVEKPGLLQEVVGSTLTRLSGLDTLSANAIGTAVATGALAAIGHRPDLLDTDYADVLASFAGLLAAAVQARTLTGLQAADIASAAADAVLLHPNLFADAQAELAGKITGAVLAASRDDPARLLVGATLVDLVRRLFAAFARHGADVAAAGSIGQLQKKLSEVLGGGLAAASAQLGKGLDLAALPGALDALVIAWARGDAAAQDPNSPLFGALFAHLAANANPTPAIA